MPLSVGDKLGPYEIVAFLGGGGMGEVWKARDTRLNRIVAVKRLKARHSARFEQEARAIAALNHPHICQIYDIGASPDGLRYLVLEYIDGAPVKGPMAVEDAVRAGIQIASALEAAHAKGILHRDLKPGNVLLGASGPKLLDFGLAKRTDDSEATQTMAVMGTPLYMSPEQAEGRPLDARSDIFSFGSVLYELLSGRRAFESLASVLRDEPEVIRTPLGEVAARCLRKAPQDRYQNMSDVKAALQQILSKPAEAQLSIAVLPFANMSGDKEQEYFSDGLAEEIINALVKIPGLKVIARTSAFAFKGQNTDIRRIADALGVLHVLEGSVRRSGQRIRVTAQLITAADGSHVWSERFDRELTDVFDVQDEIAAAVAGALRATLVSSLSRKHQPNLPAYEAFLQGRQQLDKLTPEGFDLGKKYLEQAIALDPDYADPHTALGSYYYYLAVGNRRPSKEAMPLARASAMRALELDPSDAGAHAVLCFVAGFYAYDWQEAQKQHRLTMAVPAPSWARAIAALHLIPLGGFEGALREIETAVALDPLNPVPRVLLMVNLTVAGLYDRAIAEARKAIEIDEHQWAYRGNLANAYGQQGRFTEALDAAERAFQLRPEHWQAIGILAGILACLGERIGRRRSLRKCRKPRPLVGQSTTGLVRISTPRWIGMKSRSSCVILPPPGWRGPRSTGRSARARAGRSSRG